MREELIVKGAREHNLKSVDISLPREKFIVFTGLSGSGKSSLAFDTIFAEGQRRYVESLSSYARQFLGQMDKPDVDFIEGLSPAVSIDQKSTSKNPRSTVGTITEIYDYLRLLYARAGSAYCPICDEEVVEQTTQQIVDKVLEHPLGTKLQVLAPVIRGRKGEYIELFSQLLTQGFSRVMVDGHQYKLDSVPPLEKKVKHNIEVIVDRIVLKDNSKTRLTDSVESSLKLADGRVIIDYIQGETSTQTRFSIHRACPNEHELTLDEIEPRTFSFNAPQGACSTCLGIGTYLEVDPELILGERTLTLRENVIGIWAGNADYFHKQLASLGIEHGFDIDTPWNELSKEAKEIILYGKDYKVEVEYRNRWGRLRQYTSGFEGAVQYLKRKYAETESDIMRQKYEAYMREIPCKGCNGARLKKEVLSVKIGGLNIAQFCDLPISEAKEFLDNLSLDSKRAIIAKSVLVEILARLKFLVDVGLTYLTLSRSAKTLSGGEAQRIRLATQIGSGLVGVLYVLDEPSIGLHQKDNQKLIEALVGLKNLGNTLIVVEHDEDTMKAADWIVDIGPGAGEYGGNIIHSGTYEELLKNTDSITADYLSGRKEIAIPSKRRKADIANSVIVEGAKENNLKNVKATIPLGVFTAVTGVSGSGKSTLINGILYQALVKKLHGARTVPGAHKKVTGIENLDKVVHVDQSPIGRTPRSNPATYTGVWDNIRKLFAQTPEAKMRGYGPGRFSFNVAGGRCEACKGDGTLKIEMNFLPDVYVPCEQCHGARYNRETLEIRYKGKNVADVLDMPISAAVEFFEHIPSIARHLRTLTDVGLGYIRLGQSAPTLSGGEAQRVKLASELQKRSNGRTIYVLDEPTTGLHIEDINKLLVVLNGLVDKGNTVVVIEHNLDVIKCADWIIDMGPEGGSQGGKIVASGAPEKVAKTKGSYTGMFLKDILAKKK